MIDILNQYNAKYIQNNSCGDTSAKAVFEFNDCSSKLILSAPHATRSFCNKKEKKADLYTGAITKYIGEINNISTIIRNRYTPHKDLISDFIIEQKLQDHYFLDIHGFNQDIDYDICLGTGELEAKDYPYVKEIVKIIKNYKLKPAINNPKYTGKVGFTGRYQRKFFKPNIIQLELKYYLRDFYNQPETFKKTTNPLLNEIVNLYK